MVCFVKKQKTPTATRRNLFEIKYTGEENFLIVGGGQQFWADGVENRTVLEVKLVLDLRKSPYILGSKTPEYVRANVIAEARSEFERIALILKDDNNPLTELRVIVNEPKAAPFFESLLNEFQIYGEVVIKTE